MTKTRKVESRYPTPTSTGESSLNKKKKSTRKSSRKEIRRTTRISLLQLIYRKIRVYPISLHSKISTSKLKKESLSALLEMLDLARARCYQH
jgi:hypothetical protein